MSPAHWVAKNKEETRFRLVTDLRHLNQAIMPETSVFPTPSRVMAQVNLSSTTYIVCDLLSGYHQVGIKEEDRHLFSFLLEQGVFNYTATPIGFTNSGHCFVNAPSILIADLDVITEVDDCLLEGATEDQVIDKFVQFLERCHKFNIKISRRKIQLGPVVNFAALTLMGGQGYRPHIEKSEAIQNLAAPTSVKEVRSFVGMEIPSGILCLTCPRVWMK